MKLIIGGLAQGKLHYVLQKEGNEKSIIFDGVLPEEGQIQEAWKKQAVKKDDDYQSLPSCCEEGTGRKKNPGGTGSGCDGVCGEASGGYSDL